MADLLAEYITTVLIEAPTLAAVEGRVHHAHLDQLVNIVYPCIVFNRRMSSDIDPDAPYEWGELVMQFLSDQSYDEARALYDVTRPLLDRLPYTVGGRTVYLRLRRGAFSDTLPPDEGTIYRVLCGWEIREVG